jgi:hypothetical protein
MLKRLLAKAFAALAIHPAFRGASATPAPSQQEIPGPDWDEEFLREMDAQCIAVAQRRDGSDWVGERVSRQEQARIQAGRKLANACLAGTAETDRFISERTR